jgi:hypothetical protein
MCFEKMKNNKPPALPYVDLEVKPLRGRGLLARLRTPLQIVYSGLSQMGEGSVTFTVHVVTKINN